jgi:DNA-binding transcriptional regulator YhcF (GntR family)
VIRLLCEQEADLYDWPVDGDEAGELLVDAARPGYRQVAATLRQKILSGELAPGTAIPANSLLAKDFDVSMSLANAAVTQLANEGLVRVEHGRPTVVLARRKRRAEITVRWMQGDTVPADVLGAVADRLAAAEEADPAITDADVLASSDLLTLAMDVTAPDPAHAAARAWMVTRRVLSGGSWDLDGASVEARPAGDETSS